MAMDLCNISVGLQSITLLNITLPCAQRLVTMGDHTTLLLLSAQFLLHKCVVSPSLVDLLLPILLTSWCCGNLMYVWKAELDHLPSAWIVLHSIPDLNS